jgi:predicted metal-dependent hydrolase
VLNNSVETIGINGKDYAINRILTRNRNAWARLRDNVLTISIPSRWPEKDKKRIGDELLRKSVSSIEKGRWTGEAVSRLRFSHGQRLNAFGQEFELVFVPSSRFKARAIGNRIEVSVNGAHDKKDERASETVKRFIVRTLMPQIRGRVERFNALHFQSGIKNILIRDNISRWGSCSRDGSISLNLRLLFMPEGILDYVIVHELAHTKYRSHGPRFWALVERIMPDHKERRRWLKENGWSYPKSGGVVQAQSKTPGQQTLFQIEEPY